MIYIIRAGDSSWYKIGVTESDISIRISTLQTGSPEKLHLMKMYPGGFLEEKAIHKKFSYFRGEGEWFNLSKDSLGTLLDDTWYNKNVYFPCDFYRKGDPNPCGCNSSSCLFCEESIDLYEFI